MISKEIIVKLYIIDKNSIRKIAKILNCSHNNIRYYMKKFNIKSRSKEEAMRNNTLNYDFFKVWTKDMAWILGFIFADGNIESKSNRIKIELSNIDKEILYFIRDNIDKSLYIKEYDRIVDEKTRKYAKLSFSSAEMAKDLNKLGVIPNKTFIKKFNNFPNEYMKDVIRGYFDGNGSVGIYNYGDYDRYRIQITSGSEQVLNTIKDYLKIGKVKKRKNKNYFDFLIETKRDFIKFFNTIYDNNSFSLKRKKNKFLQLKELNV